MIIKAHKNLDMYTNIKSTRLYALSQMVSELMRMPIQPNKAIVGANAFAHSSGIHHDGFLKNSENYEIINPELVGAPCASIALTARSSRSALKHRLKLLGYEPDKQELDHIYENFLTLAEEKSDIHNQDLIDLADQVAVF